MSAKNQTKDITTMAVKLPFDELPAVEELLLTAESVVFVGSSAKVVVTTDFVTGSNKCSLCQSSAIQGRGRAKSYAGTCQDYACKRWSSAYLPEAILS